MLHVTDFMFNDHNFESVEEYDRWIPEDPDRINEWVKVLVGTKEGEGHWFQINICTFEVMQFLSKKEYAFPIPAWVSVDELISRLDKFISNTLPEDLNLESERDYGLAMENLAKYWLWEYAKA